MPPTRYTSEQKTEALKLYESNGPTAVEKQLGIPKGTVTGWARANKIRTVRNEKTREATEARQIDTRALRASLAGDSLAVARKALNLINEQLDEKPQSLRDLGTIYGIFTDKHIALERVDSSERDLPAVDAWLQHMMGGTGDDTGSPAG